MFDMQKGHLQAGYSWRYPSVSRGNPMSLPSLHRALYAFLSTYPPLVAQVGTRVYPSVAPSSAVFPYVTVHDLHVGSHYHLQGPSATHDTLVQVDCWALAAEQSKKIAALIRQAVDGQQAVWEDLDIDGLFIESELDTSEMAEDGSERVYHRR